MPSTVPHSRRVFGAFTRLSISSALALALFSTPGEIAGASYGPIGAAFRVNTTILGSQLFPAVAVDAQGNYVVAWEGNDGYLLINDIYAQRYSSRGVPLGAEFRVNTFTTGAQRLPSIAMDAAGDFVVAWQSAGQDGSSDGIFAQR